VSDERVAVGAVLAQARRDAGLSTADLSEATRIREHVIEAIERGNVSVAGGEIYARGHIRVMAGALGLDAAALLARLDAPVAVQVTGPQEPVPAAPAPRASAGHHASLAGDLARTVGTKPRRSGPNWSAVMVAALALIIAVGAVQLYRGTAGAPAHPAAVPQVTTPSASVAPVAPQPSSTPVSSPASSPSASSGQPAPSGSASAPGSSASPPAGVVAQGNAVTVGLTVTGGACWMRVTTSGQTLFEGTLSRGATRTFQGKSRVKLLLGNAGGVSLVVNGVDVGSPGGAGQVVTVSFGPGNPTLGQA
jgi:cytoskeletal protein RodZ